MLYFRSLALIFGVLMLTLGPFISMRGQSWIALYRGIVYPEKRPVWVLVAGAASVFLVLLTWYAELTTRVHLSWIMTLFISLAIPKFYLLVFQYSRTRDLILALMERGRLFSLGLAGVVYCMGFLILCLGVFAF